MRLTYAPMAARGFSAQTRGGRRGDVAGAVPAASAADEVERDVGPAGGVPNVPSANLSAASRRWSCRLRRLTHPDYALPPPRHHPSSSGRRQAAYFRAASSYRPVLWLRRLERLARARADVATAWSARVEALLDGGRSAADYGQHSQGRRGLVRSPPLQAAGYPRGRSAQDRYRRCSASFASPPRQGRGTGATATARSKRAALPELDACVSACATLLSRREPPVTAELDAAPRGAEWRDSARLALDERPRRLETLEALAAAAVGLPLKLPYSAELDAARGALPWEERLRLLVPAAAAAAASPAALASEAGDSAARAAAELPSLDEIERLVSDGEQLGEALPTAGRAASPTSRRYVWRRASGVRVRLRRSSAALARAAAAAGGGGRGCSCGCSIEAVRERAAAAAEWLAAASAAVGAAASSRDELAALVGGEAAAQGGGGGSAAALAAAWVGLRVVWPVEVAQTEWLLAPLLALLRDEAPELDWPCRRLRPCCSPTTRSMTPR